MTLTLPQSLVDEMVQHARDDLPNECCGVIGRGADGALTLWRATNEEASPFRFNIPSQQVFHLNKEIDGADGDWLVIYHSHVRSEARPSPTDLNIARLHKGLQEWPYWVIVSLEDETMPSVRAWRIDDGDAPDTVQAAEIPLEISEDGSRHRFLAGLQRRFRRFFGSSTGAQRRRLEMIEADGRPAVRDTEL